MKIAFFVNTFPAPSQTFITNQIKDLIDEGHSVEIFARKDGRKKINNPVRTDVLDKCKFCFYSQYRISSYNEILLKYLRFVFSLSLASIHNPYFLSRLFKATRHGEVKLSLNTTNNILFFLRGPKLSYDVIHCHFGPNGNIAAVLKLIGFLDGKLVTTFHGYDMTSYLKNRGEKAYDLLFKSGDLFLPISERWERKLIGLGCNSQKLRVHRMGVDLGRVERIAEKEHKKTINLLSVARLVEKKGISYGVKSVANALKTHPNLKYRIVGDGPLRVTLENLIKELRVSDKIELLGWKSQEEVFTLLRDTDIFIAPSVTDQNGDQEGIPVTLMEAMAHAIPVLSTLHSGIPELVEDGTHGFLVPERDVEALSEKLAYLVAHTGIRTKMGEAGRNFIIENYDNKKLNDRLLKIYEQLKDGV